MKVRRLLLLAVCIAATVTVVAAQPKKGGPTAPAKDTGTPAVPGAGSGSDAGSAVETADEEPPKDMEGKDENPDAPNSLGGEEPVKIDAPVKMKNVGYPIEEALRPITLPKGMSEVGIGPHVRFGFGEDSEYMGSDALRGRYGITRQVQLGLTYAFGGIYDDPATVSTSKLGFHTGKAVGLDVTVMLKDWLGVRFGIPVWIDSPGMGSDASGPAVSVSLGAPIKFTFGDKYAIGGLDDVLNIAINRFAPTYDQEALNAINANEDDTNTTLSRGYLKLSAFGVMQHDPKLAFIGRFGFLLEDFTATSTRSDALNAGAKTFIRGGVSFTPRKYVDVGGSLGFDDLAELGSFGPAVHVAFRI